MVNEDKPIVAEARKHMTLYRLTPETNSPGRAVRTVQTGPVSALIAQVLLIAAIAHIVRPSGAGLNSAGRAVGSPAE
jgi:predicted transcriptional regulator